VAIYEFDVGITTHELLQEGVLVAQWILVQVEAPSWVDASCLAIQFAGCHGYATECLTRI